MVHLKLMFFKAHISTYSRMAKYSTLYVEHVRLCRRREPPGMPSSAAARRAEDVGFGVLGLFAGELPLEPRYM